MTTVSMSASDRARSEWRCQRDNPLPRRVTVRAPASSRSGRSRCARTARRAGWLDRHGGSTESPSRSSGTLQLLLGDTKSSGRRSRSGMSAVHAVVHSSSPLPPGTAAHRIESRFAPRLRWPSLIPPATPCMRTPHALSSLPRRSPSRVRGRKRGDRARGGASMRAGRGRRIAGMR